MMMIHKVGLSKTTLGFMSHKSSFGWFQIGICLAQQLKRHVRCLFGFVSFKSLFFQ
jgi:hypothetical protein